MNLDHNLNLTIIALLLGFVALLYGIYIWKRASETNRKFQLLRRAYLVRHGYIDASVEQCDRRVAKEG